jgi:stage II sporulation protein P
MAFAFPGSTIEFLQEPVFEEEENVFIPEEKNPFPEEEEELVLEISTPEIIQKIPENRKGKVTETKYSAEEGGIYVSYKNAMIKNYSHHSAAEIKKKLETGHSLSFSEDSAQILLYHTHATEAFEKADTGFFDTKGTWRSTDPEENMISVGDVLTSVLTEKGFSVIHDGTMHDDPSYKGSYQRSALTIKNHLSENPGITVCLDIHRDAIEPSETEIIKPTALINGKKAAQIMIISGCDDGTMDMPGYWENLRFAAALADKLEELYPGLCRPILFDYRKYNMDLSPGLLLIEIGATGNTLSEAQYSAELLGNALCELFAE